MPLRRDYTGQRCSLARSLEIVGERWSLLVLRDAFYGARAFGEFAGHLGIPRAVLSERLKALVAERVLERVPYGGREHYRLTPKGLSLWPTVYALMQWGDEHYGDRGPRRIFSHAADSGTLDAAGRCPACGGVPGPADIVVAPGPGLEPPREDDDAVTAALRVPHRLLEPLHG